MQSNTRHWPVAFLLLLIAADLVLICLSTGFYLGYIGDANFAIETDRGHAEVYQYIKAFWITLMFGTLLLAKRQLVFGVAALLFMYLLFDDALQIHEEVGLLLVDPLGLKPALGMRARDFGELIVSMTVGGVILSLGAIGYRLGNALARRVCIHLVIGCFALAFFGIFVDMIHMVLIENALWVNIILIIIEDGGEMFVFSAFAWYSYSTLRQLLPGLSLASPLPSGEAD